MRTLQTAYNLDVDLVSHLLGVWLPGVEFRNSDKKRVLQLIKKAATALGVWDENAQMPVLKSTSDYQYEVIKQAYDAATRNFLPSSDVNQSPYFLQNTEQKEALYKTQLIEKENINRINKQAAVALPGLGEKSASKLIAARELAGGFSSWDEVKKGSKISTENLESLMQEAYIGSTIADQMQAASFESVRNLGVGALLNGLINKEIIWEQLEEKEDTFSIIYFTLGNLTDYILKNRHRPKYWRPSNERLARGSNYLSQYNALQQQMCTNIDKVGYVKGSQYLKLIEYLLAQATTSIYLNLFFFYTETNSQSLNLVNLIADAVDRGIDVKIILDNDLEGDPHEARNVNANTFEELKNRNIPFRTSYPDQTNHTKMVIIDQKYVLSGSHNWTLSSFYRYEETSFLVQSVEFAEKAANQFLRLYEMLSENSPRNIYLEELEYINAVEAEQLLAYDIPSEISTEAKRIVIAEATHIDSQKLNNLYLVIQLMQIVKISETTALALVTKGFETALAIGQANEEDIRNALSDLSHLPDPFRLRTIPETITEYLQTL